MSDSKTVEMTPLTEDGKAMAEEKKSPPDPKALHVRFLLCYRIFGSKENRFSEVC